jgi:glucosamine 6-phosphate synthetase-like amidotransferase/phosphosugar isomerase protein
MRAAVKLLRGSFTLLAVHADDPERIVGVRRNSPLVAGIGDGENFLASDVEAFIDYTKRAIELGQDEIITITPELIEIIMDPEQRYYPRLATNRLEDGSFISPPLEDLDPKIEIALLEEALGYKAHPNSYKARGF